MGEDVGQSNPYLQAIYDGIRQSSLDFLVNNNFSVDPELRNVHDDRRGLTLLIRPPAHVQDRIQAFLQRLRAVVPGQYIYPRSDLHITVLSIISCYPAFKLESINQAAYCKMVREALREQTAFDIHLRGLVFSAGAVMIQGLYSQGTLDTVRNRLRQLFKNSSLQQSIDRRYVLETAHMTIMRYHTIPANKQQLLTFLESAKQENFGHFRVRDLHLVSNDWYQRQAHTQEIDVFALSKQPTKDYA